MADIVNQILFNKILSFSMGVFAALIIYNSINTHKIIVVSS
jgi:hypothetical protein